jgi:hypothetical protein
MDMMPKEDAKQALEQALLNGRPMLVAGKSGPPASRCMADLVDASKKASRFSVNVEDVKE